MHFPKLKYASILLLIFFTGCSKNYENIHVPDDGSILDILYMSNMNGSIENCECGEPPLGGLAKTASVIEAWRAQKDNVIVVDGGDTFNSYPFIELNQAIIDAYKIIKPDIWALAEQEFIEGFDFLNKALTGNDIQILATNYSLKVKTVKSFKRNLSDSVAAVFYSYLSPDVMPQNAVESGSVTFTSTLDIYRDINKKDLNILLFHGDLKKFDQLKNNFSGFDIILLAHQVIPVYEPDSQPFLMGGLFDGEKIIHISLHKKDSGFKISGEFIDIVQEIQSNTHIENLVNTFNQKLLE